MRRRPQGREVPTLIDVARAVGVSRTTASNAFSRPDQLSETLRATVLETAQRMGYPGPNPMARRLRTGRAGAVGVVFPEDLAYAFSDPVAIAFLMGIAPICEAEDAGVLILSAVDEEAARRTVHQAVVDGFIIHCLAAETAVINSVLERRVPVVTVDLGGRVDVPSVEIEDRAGARQAAVHLAELGHRRIAIISMETKPDGYAGPLDPARRAQGQFAVSRERLIGYDEGLLDHGIDLSTVVTIERPGTSRATAAEAAYQLLSDSKRPTAILAMSDEFALGVIEAASDLGLQIPNDLSVVGFDDIPVSGQAQPALTTVHQPLIDKGRIAAELLFGRRKADKRVVLATELVVRDTTGPPPTQLD